LDKNIGAKATSKMLMKLNKGVNFIKILQLFCTKVLCAAFLQLQFGFVIFWRKYFGAKTACKMLMKLTKGFGHHSRKESVAKIRRSGLQVSNPQRSLNFAQNLSLNLRLYFCSFITGMVKVRPLDLLKNVS